MNMDRKEFETRATRLRPQLTKMAYKCIGNNDDADDIAQDTLLKLWCMREQLDEYHSVEALAMVICRHLSLDRLKKKGTTSLEDAIISDIEPSPEDIIEQTEKELEIHRLIDCLPDGQQTILRLKHLDEMETTEIAKMIGSTEVAVRVQLSRARNRIKELFLKHRL